MRLFTIIKSNSERVPSKNFQEIAPLVPLWKWTTERLNRGSHPIYINTDSDLILKSIQDYKNIHGIPRLSKHIEWETRSAELGSPVESMLLDFCYRPDIEPDEIICLFHVTSPFVSLDLIENAAQYLLKGYDSVQSVRKIQDFVFMSNDNNITPINYDPSKVQRTQDLEPVYMSLGAFFLSTKEKIIAEKSRLPGKTFNYILDTTA